MHTLFRHANLASRYGEGMSTEPRAGRRRVSSHATLAEAACELFLEKGYAATSVADIAQRAGVSRASFFNYFSSKGEVVWSGLDERIDGLELALSQGADAVSALRALGAGFVPDALALALTHAPAMHLDEELARESATRAARIGRAVAASFIAQGRDELSAEVSGAAAGGAVLAALKHWARRGPGTQRLEDVLEQALMQVLPAASAG